MRQPTLPKLDPADYAAEWKWDGIRVQAVREGGVRRLYSPHRRRHLRRLSRRCRRRCDFEGVIDGELLVLRDGARSRPSATCSSA